MEQLAMQYGMASLLGDSGAGEAECLGNWTQPRHTRVEGESQCDDHVTMSQWSEAGRLCDGSVPHFMAFLKVLSQRAILSAVAGCA
jgi:hypothetical protein